MIEIALYNERDAVDVEKRENAVRVHVGVGHTGEHIAQALSSNGLADYTNEALDLFSNDQTARTFDHQGDYVLIARA